MKTIIIFGIVLMICLVPVMAQFNVHLNNLGNETVNNFRVTEATPNAALGNEAQIPVGSETGGSSNRMYLTFALNFSDTLREITSANLIMAVDTVEVNQNNSIFQVLSAIDQYNDTWNTQACGNTFTDSSNCNLTQSDSNNITTSGVNVSWDVTGYVRRAFANNDDNVSFAIRDPLNSSTGNIIYDSLQTTLNLTFENIEFNITIFDEVLGKSNNFFEGKVVNIDITDEKNFSLSLSTSTGSVFVNLTPNQEYRINYDSVGFPKRDFYLTPTAISSRNIIAYLLSDDNSTDVTFTVLDSSGQELQDALLKLKRFYISSNSYDSVAMSKTNQEGEAIINVDFNDPFYQVLASINDSSTNTIGSKIFSTSVEIIIQLLEDKFDEHTQIEAIETSLSFNNNTETFSYTFDDSTGQSRTATLEVLRISPVSSTQVCTTTTVSSSSTLLCQVNTTQTIGSYQARGMIASGGADIVTDIEQVSTDTIEQAKDVFGNQGIYLTSIFAGTFGGLGMAVSPVFGIVFFLVGLAAMVYFGAFTIQSFVLFFAFVLLGGFIIWKIKK